MAQPLSPQLNAVCTTGFFFHSSLSPSLSRSLCDFSIAFLLISLAYQVHFQHSPPFPPLLEAPYVQSWGLSSVAADVSLAHFLSFNRGLLCLVVGSAESSLCSWREATELCKGERRVGMWVERERKREKKGMLSTRPCFGLGQRGHLKSHLPSLHPNLFSCLSLASVRVSYLGLTKGSNGPVAEKLHSFPSAQSALSSSGYVCHPA